MQSTCKISLCDGRPRSHIVNIVNPASPIVEECRAIDGFYGINEYLVAGLHRPLGSQLKSYGYDGRVRSVRREGDRLLLQEWGQGSCELFPLSQTNFYNQLFDCGASFVRDKNSGRTSELVVGGWHGKRLSGLILPPAAIPLTDLECQSCAGSDLQGVWQAKLWLWYWPFASLSLKVRVAEPSPGAIRAEGDSPDQGVRNEPLGVIYSPPNVKVFLLTQDGSFQGKVNPAHTKVTGHWKQAGYNVHVTFRRAEPPPAPPAAESPERKALFSKWPGKRDQQS